MSPTLSTAGTHDLRPKAFTCSGRLVPLVGTLPEEIDLRDIAGHLSRLCRFAGATQTHYSVAQHCIVVADLLAGHGAITQLYGLLHDAHEAYISDITAPTRRLLKATSWGAMTAGEYDPVAEMTIDLDAAIHARAGLVWPPPAATLNLVHAADRKAMATEVRDLLPDPRVATVFDAFGDLPQPMRGAIKPWTWIKAEEKYLEKFDDLAILAGRPSWDGAP